MTISEFRAWFDGYCEHIEKAPTEAQWARIKEQMATIDGTLVTLSAPKYPGTSTVTVPPVTSWVSNTCGTGYA